MSTGTAWPTQLAHPARRKQRAARRRLREQDTLSARLAELHAMTALLERAVAVVSAGWVQGAWFQVTAGEGSREVSAYELHLAVEPSVSGACLVGAIVQGGGGPSQARSQLVQRTLDLTWHALREEARQPVRWCPAPSVRTMRVRDLTRWNDTRDRTQREVVGLLLAAQRAVGGQRELCLAQMAGLAAHR